jgi:hypothetical protein
MVDTSALLPGRRGYSVPSLQGFVAHRLTAAKQPLFLIVDESKDKKIVKKRRNKEKKTRRTSRSEIRTPNHRLMP